LRWPQAIGTPTMMFDFELILLMIDEEELFEDRRLYESSKNIFSLECERVKAKAITKGMTEDDIKHLDLELHMEIQDKLEIVELTYQLAEELLLVALSRKMNIQSGVADYLGSAFADGMIPLMNDYKTD
jgi:hypothetical protein